MKTDIYPLVIPGNTSKPRVILLQPLRKLLAYRQHVVRAATADDPVAGANAVLPLAACPISYVKMPSEAFVGKRRDANLSHATTGIAAVALHTSPRPTTMSESTFEYLYAFVRTTLGAPCSRTWIVQQHPSICSPAPHIAAKPITPCIT
jgi:hypothetical protein